MHRSGTKVTDIEVYSVSDTNWVPSQVTWNQRPIIDGPLVATGSVEDEWGEFDVTSAISNGTVSFALNRLPSTNSKHLDALESGFGAELIIVYSDGSSDSAPIAPANTTASDGLKSINLSWDASVETDVVGYKVYRRQNDEDFFDSPIHAGVLTQNSFEDTNLLLGLPYQYVVIAVDAVGQESNFSVITTATLADSDTDGMSDNWELTYGLNTSVDDTTADLDEDLLTNFEEYNADLLPNNADTDNDGMDDGFEVTYSLDPLLDDSNVDTDGDSYTNLAEYDGGSDPTDAGSVPAPIGPSTLFTDDFEDGLANWTTNGTVSNASAAANSGSKGMRIKKSSSATFMLDTSGYSSVTLTYDRTTKNFENKEDLQVQTSIDGSNWTVLEVTQDTSWSTMTFNLPLNITTYVRFITNANSTNERGDIDNLIITAQ